MANRTVLRGAKLACLLLVCALGPACAFHTARFDIPQYVQLKQKVYPWRVGVAIDKEFTPYKITYRYWSSTNFSWSLDGLPEAYAKTLSGLFPAVETLENGLDTSTAPHDLIARMWVDKIHFDGSNTTDWYDSVDLTMRFSLERPNGTEVFRTTISAKGVGKYQQKCTFGLCTPRPPTAFANAFENVFRRLASQLVAPDIHLEER